MCGVFLIPCVVIWAIAHLIPYPVNWLAIGGAAALAGNWVLQHLV